MTVSVNNTDWAGLSDADRSKINEIIAANFKGETVAPGQTQVAGLSGNPACDAACNAAETVAMGACNALPFPASVVCMAAARAAGDLCRSRC